MDYKKNVNLSLI